jgi:type I restriction enzyme S subunit
LEDLKENLSQQIKTLTQYRQSLIHECVTGKKRVYFGDISKGESHAIN